MYLKNIIYKKYIKNNCTESKYEEIKGKAEEKDVFKAKNKGKGEELDKKAKEKEEKEEKKCAEWLPRHLVAYSSYDVAISGLLSCLIGKANVGGPGYVTFGATVLVELWRSKHQHQPHHFFVKVSVVYFIL
jgi:hypothetical protein